MKLTTEQVELISKEIIQGGLKYQDLYEELLDHYITAIEDRMASGMAFGEAFGEVHSDFVNYKCPVSVWDRYDIGGKPLFGLVKLQAEYEESLTGEIKKRHWQIMGNYFRWPTVVTSLLVGALTFQFAYLVPKKYFMAAMFIIAFSPILVVLPQSIKRYIEYYISKKGKFAMYLKENAVAGRTVFCISLANLIISTFNFSEHLFDYDLRAAVPVYIWAMILCFYLAYSLSFYQLYKERFKVKTT